MTKKAAGRLSVDGEMGMYERFLDQITEFIFVETPVERADMIFVPGNGYPQMAEQAAGLWKQGMAPYVLPSGRYSICAEGFSGVLDKGGEYTGSYDTEWMFLREVLLENGVDERCILKEDRASYTYENAIYSRQCTDEMGLVVEKGILCCKSYHARRCLLYYQLLFPDTQFYVSPSDTEGISRCDWYRSKKGIEAVLGEVERCGGQFYDIIKDLEV